MKKKNAFFPVLIFVKIASRKRFLNRGGDKLTVYKKKFIQSWFFKNTFVLTF